MNRIIISQLALVFVFTACSNQPPELIPIEEQLSKKGYRIDQQVNRITNYRLNGWSSVDRFNAIINVGTSTNYLITFLPACDGLRGVGGLAFSTTDGDLTDRDQLVIRPYANVKQYCPIHEIYLLAKISNT